MPNMPNTSSPEASNSHVSLPRYPPAALQVGESRTHAEPDVEAGINEINIINPSTSAATVVMYGHDEKFAMFGQI